MTTPTSSSSSSSGLLLNSQLGDELANFDLLNLHHVEPVIKHHPINVEHLKQLNPALAEFYMEHLAPESQAVTVQVRISNDFEKLPGDQYKWTLRVEPLDPTHASLIRSVLFELHPTFSPSSVQVTSPPFELSRIGWGVFKVAITVVDSRGRSHPLSHKLSFTDPDNGHVAALAIQPPHPSRPITASALLRLAAPPRTMQTLGIDEAGMHGRLGVGKGWDAPLLATFCDEEARPGYARVKAHEYSETPATLRAKVRCLADLIRHSEHMLAYTGAGISTAAGVADYASRAKDSLATRQKPQKRGLEAEPTYAHFVLAALQRAGMLKCWVQQNHDGLPQKAGVAQEALNEIHGAWFDPSNPVVPMEGTLRGDLCGWMEREIEATDLALALGTSLCGMNADRCISTPGKRAVKQGVGLGSVIVGFQQTRLDEVASLRIYAKIDEVMLLLAAELDLEVKTEMYRPQYAPAALTAAAHVFRVPYHRKNGNKSSSLHTLDLSVGAKVMLLAGPGKGFKGEVVRVPSTPYEHYSVRFPCTREGPDLGKYGQCYALGTWMVEAFTKGTMPFMSIANY